MLVDKVIEFSVRKKKQEKENVILLRTTVSLHDNNNYMQDIILLVSVQYDYNTSKDLRHYTVRSDLPLLPLVHSIVSMNIKIV